jgi:citrate synthase
MSISTVSPSSPSRSTPSEPILVPRGLANVVVTDTTIGDVRGWEGFYHYRQYSAIELARLRSLEEVWFLLYDGELPTAEQSSDFTAELAPLRQVPADVSELLPRIAAATAASDALGNRRTSLSVLGNSRGMRPLWDRTPGQRREDALAIAAVVPTLVAARHRIDRGLAPVAPRDDLSHAENYLYMVTGDEPDPAVARAVERYLISTIDHGFNASTFTGRVIASTGADMASCVIGALGALSGPLHGGAPSRALDTLDDIGTPDRIDAWITERVLAGDRIMGFGHPVYRTEDPRSRLLREIAQEFGGDLVDFAVTVERRVLALLEELKPGRQLHTNVEFYAGVVMSLCGLPREMFTPTFAVARVIGWTANILEQAQDTKIIRPSARYVGPPPPQSVPPHPGAGR